MDPVFNEELKSFEIIALQETHLKKQDCPVLLESFDVFATNGMQTKNNRVFGGLAFLVDKSIRPGVKWITSPDKDYMWLKIKKEFFHLDKDLYLCNVYIPPKNSNFLKDGEYVLEQLENLSD